MAFNKANNKIAHDFSRIPVSSKPRSVFPMNHSHKTTFNVGQLVPILTTEIIPGDTATLRVKSVVRTSTPIAPVMDNAFVDVYAFYTPFRILYENWTQVMGENKTDAWTDSVVHTVPKITAPASTGWLEGTLAAYFGAAINDTTESISALYPRAYALIYNEWFRSQNIQDPVLVPLDDSDMVGVNGSDSAPDPDQFVKCGYPVHVNRIHDYFSACLPSPQKGPSVLLPLGSSAPVLTGADNVLGANNIALKFVKYNGSDLPSGKVEALLGDGVLQYGSTTANATLGGIKPKNLHADLSLATAATVNDLRLATAIQNMYESDARGGTRYREFLENHFGVKNGDSRMQIPEFLGAWRENLQTFQTVQTSSTDSTTPQGNTAAFSLTNLNAAIVKKGFTEHGVLMVLAVVRTNRSYQNGSPKFLHKTERFDFYDPLFDHIGEQAVLTRELHANSTVNPNTVWGYLPAWDEYRYLPNRISGGFRSNAAPASDSSLSFWHYADNYIGSTTPTLSDGWLKENYVQMDRTLAVQKAVHDQILADFYFELTMSRCMSVNGVPGFMDHPRAERV